MTDKTTPTPEARLQALGLTLPQTAPAPIGAFANVRRCGNLLYVSGQGPVEADGSLRRGKVGVDVTAEEAQEDARLVALNIIAALKTHLSDLSRVTGVIKLLGLVNAHPEFQHHPFVIDGASTLLHEVFGEAGVHARSSFGVGSLPNRITVEIEAIVEIAE